MTRALEGAIRRGDRLSDGSQRAALFGVTLAELVTPDEDEFDRIVAAIDTQATASQSPPKDSF